jgi:hypothetical protein
MSRNRYSNQDTPTDAVTEAETSTEVVAVDAPTETPTEVVASEPDFTSQLFVPVEEAQEMRRKIVDLEETIAKLQSAAAVTEEQRAVEVGLQMRKQNRNFVDEKSRRGYFRRF